jgi:hypothetical protein
MVVMIVFGIVDTPPHPEGGVRFASFVRIVNGSVGIELWRCGSKV